ncbi:hypothetical protein [Motilimonas cestriensis]|uniref:hypothetical protein n=1 Tax=Motilimonas cestriensis TaxID=2742685 RepID=UPI003DA4409C
MSNEVDISGFFFDTQLEEIHQCTKLVFSGKDYQYKPKIEIQIESDDLDFWIRDDDTANADGTMDFLLCGTYLGSYALSRELMKKLMGALDERGIKYQIDMVEQTETGELVSDMEQFSNIVI